MTIRKLYDLGIVCYRDKVFLIYDNRCLHYGIPSQYMDIPLVGYTVMYESPGARRSRPGLPKGG